MINEIEIEIGDVSVDLPITIFPPFKLRSSMVDKDPVIWVHLIEVYIQYVQTILQLRRPLTSRSEQQLCLFVKSYLHEIAEEQGQILSLGLINVQITENLKTLNLWILELIKQLGVLALKLNGEALWDFARIYIFKYTSAVRGIIDGSYKPRDKKTISSISLVHKHIEGLIGNGKFDKFNLKVLAALLDEKSKLIKDKKDVKAEKQVNKSKAKTTSTSFTESFVSVNWLEILEMLYAKGEGRFAQLCKDIAIISLISISSNKIAFLATELGITSYHSLHLFPLFSGIIVSRNFKEYNPGLEKRLPFLKQHTPKTPVSQTDVKLLVELFPTLTIEQTEMLLRKNDYNVETVTNLLLENSALAVEREASSSLSSQSRHVLVDKSTDVQYLSSKKVIRSRSHVPDEAKNKTLQQALSLLYEADEDERDDTYDDAEAAAPSAENSKYEKVERFLWEIFKKDPTSFEKTSRKSRKRKEMKDETKWSDEQIEGWARMIQKSPKRAKLLEEKYMFRGNKPWSTSFTKNASEEEEKEEERGVLDSTHRLTPELGSPTNERHGNENKNNNKEKKPENKPSGNQTARRQQAHNEKNKASRANHNRKAGRDKKLAKGFN